MVSQELICPVDVYQDPEELRTLLERVKEVNPKRILEVGSLYGGTLWHWMHTFPDSTILSIDMVAQGVPEHPKEKIEACRGQWAGWAEQFNCDLQVCPKPSNSVEALATAEKYSPYDFIFVDAGHSYREVQGDFFTYWPLVRPGGLMAFHDCACRDHYPAIDVGTWWRDLEETGNYSMELISCIPDWWGIGVIQK